MKKTISFLLTLCMIVGLMPAAMAAKKATFKDVPENMWCFKYVEYVAEEGYFKGTTATTFEPNGPMTRQQFVVVLSRMVNAKVNNNQSPFPDVPAGSYSAGAIAWAVKNKIVQGYEDGTFHPTESITRQQMAAMMNRFMTYYANNYGVRYISKNAKINFKDAADIGSYAKSAVDYCVKYGLILGYEDGTFRPNATATRAHVAAIIQRLDEITRKNSGGGSSSYTYYTITFDGAKVNGQSSASVREGSTYTVPAPDAKNGYTFEKWNDGGSKVYNVGDTFTVTGDMTLYAEWAKDIDPSDLLLVAFAGPNGNDGAVAYINDNIISRYDDAQNSLQNNGVNINSITVNKLDTDFTGNNRVITASASAELNEATINSLVKRAIDYAIALVKSVDPSAELTNDYNAVKDILTNDYNAVKDIVIDVVEALGLTWTGKDIEALAEQIYDQGYDAADDIWDMFQANGQYIFNTVDVNVNGATIFTATAATKSTDLGAKASAKALAKAIAKDLYEDLKRETVETQEITLNTGVELDFDVVPAAVGYPNVYTLNVALTLKNDMLTYKYDATNDTHNLKFTISKEMQGTYDDAMNAVAAEAMAAAKGALSGKITGLMNGYLGGTEVTTMVSKLVELGIYDDADEAMDEISNMAAGAADNWLNTNLALEQTPAAATTYYLPYDFFWLQNGQIEMDGSSYKLTMNGANTGRRLFDNEALIAPITNWTSGLVATISVSDLVNGEMSKVSGGKTVRQTYQEEIVNAFKTILEKPVAGTITYADVLGQSFQTMFGYANMDAMFASGVTLSEQIDAIDLALSQEYDSHSTADAVQQIMLQVLAGDGTNPGMLDNYYNTFVGSMDTMVKDMINACDLKDYLMNLVLTDLGLDGYAANEFVVNATAKETQIQNYLNAYIDSFLIDANDITVMIDAEIADLVAAYSQYLQVVPYVQSINTFDEMKLAKLDTVADALASDELQTLITKADIDSAKMNKAMDALVKAIEKLPADAIITINSVEYSKAKLDDLKAAAQGHNIALVCDEMAELVAFLGDLCLDNFDSIPVVVEYGTRDVTFVLTIDIEV